MAVLTWIKDVDGAVIPFQTNIHVGSRIRVWGRDYAPDQTPDNFQVFRGYGSLARRFREKSGRPPETLMADLPADAAKATSTAAISKSLIVTAPRLRLRVPLFVRDSFGNRTNPNPIFAARLGGINVGPNVTVLGNGGSIATAEVTTAVDPELELRVLLPWQSGDDATASDVKNHGTVQDLIRDIAIDIAESTDGVEPEFASDSMREDIGWALPSEPLPGWSVELSTPTMYLGDGETAAIAIRFTTPTPGAAAFAIQARGIAPDGEIETVASEIYALAVEPGLERISLTLL
jgi:hypothetical protein